MKITFLGSGHGVPVPGRNCTSMLVEIGDAAYLIDGGSPVMEQLLERWNSVEDRAGLNPIKGVFTTHLHGDHTLGLVPLLHLAAWYHKEASWVTYLTDEKVKDGMIQLINAVMGKEPYPEDRLPLRIAKAGEVFRDENVKITYIPTAHTEDSHAILLEAEGKRVVFCGDLSRGLRADDFPKVALEEETDLVICELAHFNADAVRPYMEQCKTKQWCFNHVSNLATGEKLQAIRAMENDFSFPVYTANDNDEILL